MKQSIIIGSVIIILVIAGAVYAIFGYPIIIQANQKEVINLTNNSKVNFNPIEKLDFSSGKNVAFLLFSNEDANELPKEMGNYRVFECRSNIALQLLKNKFWFEETSGDMVTCESKIFLYKNDELVLHASIVLTDELIGMQSQQTGWANAIYIDSLREVFLKFKPVQKIVIKF